MAKLDLRTVILLVSGLSAIMAAVLASLRRNFPASIKGMGAWAAGLAIVFVSTLLFGARGLIPDVLSIVVANLAGIAGFALLSVGSQRFFGLAPSIRFWRGVTLASAPLLSWFTFAQPHFGIRTVIMAGVMGSIAFLHCRVIWRHGQRSLGTYLAAAALAMQAASQAVRFVSAFGASADGGLFSQSAVQTAYLTLYAVCVLLMAIGVAMMANERLLLEFQGLAALETAAQADKRNALTREAQRLEELDAIKNQFIANVSHELRTPLALVLGPLDDLAHDMASCGPATQHSFNIVRRNAERLRELVEQLLDVARLDTGGVKLRTRSVDLAAFLRRTCERFQPDAAQRGLTLDVATNANDVRLFLDPDLVEKVLSNLLANALKFTPSGGRIRVELEHMASESDQKNALVAFARVSVLTLASASFRAMSAGYSTASTRRRTLTHGAERARGSACRSRAASSSCMVARWG